MFKYYRNGKKSNPSRIALKTACAVKGEFMTQVSSSTEKLAQSFYLYSGYGKASTLRADLENALRSGMVKLKKK